MSAWVVVPCLLALRDEFNSLNANRDKGADGTIGDANHTSSSDHTPDEDSDKLRNKDADHVNEVHGLDIDSTGPWPAGRTFHQIVMDVIAGEKAKWLDPNDMCRLHYVIHDRKIYETENNFEPRDYTGSDPHTNHAHFSARYETQAENDTRPFGVALEEEMDQATFIKYLTAAFKDPGVLDALLSNVKVTDYASTDDPKPVLNLRQWIGYSEGRRQVNEVITDVGQVQADVLRLTELVNSHIAGLVEGGGTVHAS